MILGGAVGNLIDRVFRGGAVVDYLDVQLFQFAIFNFADCFITVGTVLLAVYILFFMDRDDKRLKAAAEPLSKNIPVQVLKYTDELEKKAVDGAVALYDRELNI